MRMLRLEVFLKGLRFGLCACSLAMIAITVAGCGSRFPDPNVIGPYDRNVLLEEGTATWCTYCPEAAENIETLLAAHPDEFIVLALHRDDEYSSAESHARLDMLGVSAYPTIIFDGVELSGRKVSEMETALAARRTLKSFVKLDLTATLTADSVRYQITATVSQELFEPVSGTLRIALVQDTATHSRLGLLHHIVRRLPEAGAEDELILNPGDTLTVSRALPLDSAWSGELTAVAWIEAEDHEVCQAASAEVTSEDVGDFNIVLESDTIETMPDQGDDAFFYFTVKNNTQGVLTLHIGTPVELRELPSGWFALICDDGQCYGDSVNVAVSAGASTQRLHVQLISGNDGAEGKVVLTVDAGGTEVDSETFILRIAP